MFTTTYKNVEITVPEKSNRQSLEDWLDGLADTDVKESIVKIRWCERRPKEQSFQIFVRCKHPYKAESDAFEQARTMDSEDLIAKTADSLLGHFSEWININGVPKETALEGRSAGIIWYPQELPLVHLDDLPAQERAQFDMNSHALNSLWLVKVTVDSEKTFVKATIGTNIPFVSAGLLATGTICFLRQFPAAFPTSDAERERLYDTLFEHTANYVVLIRLAAHFGSRASLIMRVLSASENFKQTHAGKLREWIEEYKRTQSDEVDILGVEPYMSSEAYCSLDEACEVYRRELIAATKGYEQELPGMLNSFLGNLSIPESPFGSEPEANEDWWKSE